MQNSISPVAFVGRLFMGAIFFWGAMGAFMNSEGMLQMMTAKNVPNAHVLLYVAAIAQLIGSICLIIGYRTRLAAGGLIAFLVVVSFYMHNFWALEGEAQMAEMVHFMANLAIAGGLLYVVAYGSGRWAVDKA